MTKIDIVEKSANNNELPKLIFLLLLALLVIPASMTGIVLQYFLVLSTGFLIFCTWKLYKSMAVSKWDGIEAEMTNYQLLRHQLNTQTIKQHNQSLDA